MKEFTAYFRGSLLIKAESIEEAWEKWFDEIAKVKDLDIDNIDIYSGDLNELQ